MFYKKSKIIAKDIYPNSKLTFGNIFPMLDNRKLC